MLDDDNREPEATLERQYGLQQNVDVDRRKTRRGLIEQQQLRPHRHGSAERQQSTLSARQLTSGHFGVVGQPDESEELHHFLARTALVRSEERRVGKGGNTAH